MKQEQSITLVKQEVSPILKEAEGLFIKDAESLQEAVEILSKLNSWNDRVISDREKLTRPLNEALKEVRARYKPFELVLEAAIGSIRAKMGAYKQQSDKERKEAEEKLAGRIGDGKGKLQMSTAVRKIGELETVEKNVAGENGSVVFVSVRKFEVVDIGALPIIYHLPDEVAIRKALKEGVELPGVRYWNEQSVRNSR